MNKKQTRCVLDLAERVFWTFVQAGLGAISVEMFDLPEWAIIPIATGLAGLKGVVAKKVGSSNTAALLPAEEDTPRADPNA
jgi:hypothetical protein